MIAHKAPINAKDSDGQTPLHYATQNGHRDVAELLRQHGGRDPNPSIASFRSDTATLTTAIHGAARDGNLGKVKALLKRNPALVFSRDKDGQTPLHLAAGNGHKAVVELLLADGANVNAKANDGMTPLHEAAFWGQKDVAELLVSKAEVNAKDDDGQTPLHWASTQGHEDVAELLRQHGGHE